MTIRLSVAMSVRDQDTGIAHVFILGQGALGAASQCSESNKRSSVQEKAFDKLHGHSAGIMHAPLGSIPPAQQVQF